MFSGLVTVLDCVSVPVFLVVSLVCLQRLSAYIYVLLRPSRQGGGLRTQELSTMFAALCQRRTTSPALPPLPRRITAQQRSGRDAGTDSQ